jgi:hypothetical protein
VQRQSSRDFVAFSTGIVASPGSGMFPRGLANLKTTHKNGRRFKPAAALSFKAYF